MHSVLAWSLQGDIKHSLISVSRGEAVKKKEKKKQITDNKMVRLQYLQMSGTQLSTIGHARFQA